MHEIQWYSLFNVTSLESIKIHKNITSISGNAIYYCANLKNIEVDENNKYYSSKDGVLFNKDATTLIKYPDAKGVVYKVPEGTEKIENYAFNSANIKYLDLPEGLTQIGKYDSFGEGEFLKGVRITDSIKDMDSSIFAKSENLIIYCNSNSYAESYAIENNISYAAFNEYKAELKMIDIQFEDVNLYNKIINGALKHIYTETRSTSDMSRTIVNKNENTLTIQMYEEDVLYVNFIDLSIAQIQNLKGIESFENLEELWAQSNEITNIDIISNLINLRILVLADNKIKDITSLNNLKNLKNLDIKRNHIEDISVIQELNLTTFYADSQKLYSYVNVGENDYFEINLPNVFREAKDEDSIAYTSDVFKLINCDLSSDGTKIILDSMKIDNGVSIEIRGGKLDKTKLTVETLLSMTST